MAVTAWPNATDLKNFLAAANLIEPTPTGDSALLNYDAAVTRALDVFEFETGRRPFMTGASDETRYFTPDGTGIIDPRNGIVSVTSVKTGVAPGSTPTTLTLNEDYWLMPEDAALRGKPYEWIQLHWRARGQPRSIEVVGKFGWAAYQAIPELAFQTVLKIAALDLLPTLAMLMSALSAEFGAGLRRIAAGDTSYEYDRVEERLGKVWKNDVQKAIAYYRRPFV